MTQGMLLDAGCWDFISSDIFLQPVLSLNFQSYSVGARKLLPSTENELNRDRILYLL